jgi:hypothetical protein
VTAVSYCYIQRMIAGEQMGEQPLDKDEIRYNTFVQLQVVYLTQNLQPLVFYLVLFAWVDEVFLSYSDLIPSTPVHKHQI